MSHTAKIFTNGRSQAVRLPAAFRFESQEVFVSKDSVTGDVILSERPGDWHGFLAAVAEVENVDDFLSVAERSSYGHINQIDGQQRDPFDSLCSPLQDSVTKPGAQSTS